MQRDLFKIALLGDTCTGKSFFLYRLRNRFIPAYQSTNQIAVYSLCISAAVVQIFDTPGKQQLSFKARTTALNCRAVMVFVDHTNSQTWSKAKVILQDFALFQDIALHLYHHGAENKRKVTVEEMKECIQRRYGGRLFGEKDDPQAVIQCIYHHRKQSRGVDVGIQKKEDRKQQWCSQCRMY